VKANLGLIDGAYSTWSYREVSQCVVMGFRKEKHRTTEQEIEDHRYA